MNFLFKNDNENQKYRTPKCCTTDWANFSVVGIPWIANGGWPVSGATGEILPIHIAYVTPADGEQVQETHGFYTHFNFQLGRGINEAAQENIHFYLDGRDISKHVHDLLDLEYPIRVRDLCYRPAKPTRPGWHTVKASYEDNSGDRFEYFWRFQVVEE